MSYCKEPQLLEPHRFGVGDTVYYHSIIDGPHDGVVRTVLDKWHLGHGEAVYKVGGIVGCVVDDALSSAESGS